MKVTTTYNLSYIYPDLMNEWAYDLNDNIDPTKISPYCHKEVIWRCAAHTTCDQHVWPCIIKNRTRNKSGCPFCSTPARQSCICMSIYTLFPKLMDEWDYEKNKQLDPKKILPGSEIMVHWKCSNHTTCNEHIWTAIVNSRTRENSERNGSGCPFCARCGTKQTCSCDSALQLFPWLIDELDVERNRDFDPFKLSMGSNKDVYWRCLIHKTCDEHVWSAPISRRIYQDSGCPFCSGGTNYVCVCDSIHTLEKDLLKEWVYELNTTLDPKKISRGSEVEAYWRCSNNHIWLSIIYNRTGKIRSGCPLCRNKTESLVFNWLKQQFSVILQPKYEWCQNPHTNRKLPFDFEIKRDDLYIIIEIDGPQHFKQISNWKNSYVTLQYDTFKSITAIKHGYSIIRILQEDIWNDQEHEWKSKLEKAILSIIPNDIVYISSNEYIYNNHRELLKQFLNDPSSLQFNISIDDD